MCRHLVSLYATMHVSPRALPLLISLTLWLQRGRTAKKDWPAGGCEGAGTLWALVFIGLCSVGRFHVTVEFGVGGKGLGTVVAAEAVPSSLVLSSSSSLVAITIVTA